MIQNLPKSKNYGALISTAYEESDYKWFSHDLFLVDIKIDLLDEYVLEHPCR